MCRAQSVVSGSTLRIGSRHFSQSVFLHVKWPARNLFINPFTATGYFDIPPPRWLTFLAMLFPILKEGMGLSLLDEFEVQYHVIKK